MSTADEIEALKNLPGLYPETIDLLNRAAAAARTTTTMTTTEEIHAAAVANVGGNPQAAIVHILNVLRRLPAHLTLTRREEAQAAQTIDTTAGGRFDTELRDYHCRIARLAIGELKAQNPGYSMNASVALLADQFGSMDPRPVPGTNSPRTFPKLQFGPAVDQDASGKTKRICGHIAGDPGTTLYFIEWELNATDPGLMPVGHLYGIAIPDGQEGEGRNQGSVLYLQKLAQEYLNAFLRKYA